MSAKGRATLTYGSTTGQLALAGMPSASDYGESEYYPTPSYCVHALLRAIDEGSGPPIRDGEWVEPAVGDGAIVRAVEAVRPGVCWIASDIRTTEGALSLYREMPGRFTCTIGDFMDASCERRPWLPEEPAVLLTNPPFSLGLGFARRGIEICEDVILLLPMSFFETEERAAFLRAHPPGIYPLARRPRFIAGSSGDSRQYAWWRWAKGCEGRWYPPLGA